MAGQRVKCGICQCLRYEESLQWDRERSDYVCRDRERCTKAQTPASVADRHFDRQRKHRRSVCRSA